MLAYRRSDDGSPSFQLAYRSIRYTRIRANAGRWLKGTRVTEPVILAGCRREDALDAVLRALRLRPVALYDLDRVDGLGASYGDWRLRIPSCRSGRCL